MTHHYLHTEINVVNIKGSAFLKGDCEFSDEPLFDLQVGDTIIKIGSGKATGGNSLVNFTSPVKYCGRLFINGLEYAAFLLPPQGITGWSLFNPQCSVYWLLNFDDEFLYDFNIDINKTFRYNPVFERASTIKGELKNE